MVFNTNLVISEKYAIVRVFSWAFGLGIPALVWLDTGMNVIRFHAWSEFQIP